MVPSRSLAVRCPLLGSPSMAVPLGKWGRHAYRMPLEGTDLGNSHRDADVTRIGYRASSSGQRAAANDTGTREVPYRLARASWPNVSASILERRRDLVLGARAPRSHREARIREVDAPGPACLENLTPDSGATEARCPQGPHGRQGPFRDG